MNTHRSLRAGLVLAATLAWSVAPAVAAAGPGVQDPYRAAVASYVEAASQELEALRQQQAALAVGASPERRAQLETAGRKLDEAERLVGELREAGPDRFDGLKLRYEKMRTELIVALQAAAKTA